MPNIIEITDFAAPELDVYARLTENRLLNRHEPEKFSGILAAWKKQCASHYLKQPCFREFHPSSYLPFSGRSLALNHTYHSGFCNMISFLSVSI